MRAVLFAVVLGSLAASCAPSFPPIATARGDAALKARMAETYPPGSRGSRLREALAGQDFTLASDPAGRRWTAYDIPDNLPCYSRTRVDWREDARGRIVILTAQRNGCT